MEEDKIKRIVERFLDHHVGDGVIATRYKVSENEKTKKYLFKSYKGTKIFRVWVHSDDRMNLWRDEELCEMISNYFSLSSDEAASYVRNWFGDKYNLNKIGDLCQFIPED